MKGFHVGKFSQTLVAGEAMILRNPEHDFPTTEGPSHDLVARSSEPNEGYH